jgi:nicotinamidase-related amidase
MDHPARGRRNNPDAEENIVRLLAAWRDSGRPVFHIQHLSLEAGSLLAVGTEGAELKPEVRPVEGEPLLRKHVNSAFIGTGLEDRLRDEGISTVVVTGLTINHCVETTTRMAGNLGFDTYLVSDATATFDRRGPDGVLHSAEEIHEISVTNLYEEFATIVTTDEVVAAVASPVSGPV